MKMQRQNDLGERTKQFALAIIKMSASLPKSAEAVVIGRQVLRSGTSVGAHYREAKRAKSNRDFVSKVEGALQELEETGYWLELLADSAIYKGNSLVGIQKECNELIAIFVVIAKKVKARG